MHYWLVYKFQNRKKIYVSGTDKFGYPEHTTDLNEAWHFKDFNTAMSFFSLGYTVEKVYV